MPASSSKSSSRISFRNLLKLPKKSLSFRNKSSTSFFNKASNVEINNSTFNEFHGDATIIRFGDGQFTDVQRNLIGDFIANYTVFPGIDEELKKHVLIQSIIALPRAEAVFNDYQTKKKSGPCFEGTRVALLKEMADWMTGPDESRMYVLFGLAGIGKSTIAYTIASRAAELNLLGASFFFARDEADRKNAKKFFTTIAYQLCAYDKRFAKAIGDILNTERGSAATTKAPQEQLKFLILDPLRSMVQSRARPILIVVDALDECDEDDEHAVVTGLSQLVRLLPSFKVILTTRPQPLVNHLFDNHDGHKIFHLQDIEDKVVDGDIRLYLSHNLSLEQVRVRLLNQKVEWYARDEDIESLVKAAGRLFIIASTAVLYVLNKALSDPRSRMKKLLEEIAQDRTPFSALNHFYSVIVCSATQVNGDDDNDDDIIDRYQIIVGAILIIQTPLPVTILKCFVGMESEKIYAMLRYLQSVILLGGDDVPRIYHKSFPDYLTDPARCKNPRLLINTRIRHTEIAIRCFEIMDQHLKYNILGLGNPARFMSNKNGLKVDMITNEQLQEKIPQQLRYACVYWPNHFEMANIENVDLVNGWESFADKHMLHWFEVLSLIGKLDLAQRAIRSVLKLLPASSDFNRLLQDGLRFISKFYEVIERSALHTYYSALPFAPTGSLLYRRYITEAAHGICDVEGGPEKWDGLVAYPNHGEWVDVVKFSSDSALFISFADDKGKLKIWDAATGTPISTISGHTFAVANDFSIIASSKTNSIKYYDLNGTARGIMFTTTSEIEKLALSSESDRIAAELSDGAVYLWNSRNGELIGNFDEFERNQDSQLQFSATGTRLAYSSANGIVKVRDGIRGTLIASLECGSSHVFEFSGDGSCIASLSLALELKLWDTESGGLIAVVEGDSDNEDTVYITVSTNGSILATACDDQVKLWSRNRNCLDQVEVLEIRSTQSMALASDNILAFATILDINLYDIKTRSFIFATPVDGLPTALAFSPDCTHLVLGTSEGGMYLWDIRHSEVSCPSLEDTDLNVLALSRDCSRLACGFEDGRVELWETSSSKKQQIASHLDDKESVCALGFSPDGRLFASGSDEGTIKLWNGGDGSLRETLQAANTLQAVALSNNMLVAAWGCNVTLWSLDTLILVHTFTLSGEVMDTISIAENSALIAVVVGDEEENEDTNDEAREDSKDGNGEDNEDSGDNDDEEVSGSSESEDSDSTDSDDSEAGGISDTSDSFSDDLDQSLVHLLDVTSHTTINTFNPPSFIHTMSFLPDNSQFVVQSEDGVSISFNLKNEHIMKGPTFEHLIQLPDTPLWRGVPLLRCEVKEQYCFSALFSGHRIPVPVLWIPKDLYSDQWTQKSSMIAAGYRDSVILLRLHTN